MNYITLLGRQALKKSLQVRRQENIPNDVPLSPVDLAEKRGVNVWYKDLPSLEGMYIHINDTSHILLPSDRPMGRQLFGCAHELGHHEFQHGTKVDEYFDQGSSYGQKEENEILVDMFAGFLLMPRDLIRKSFSIRGWTPSRLTPIQAYTISCSLGVSYTGLLTHLTRGLDLIPRSLADKLSKISLPKIRNEILEQDCKERLVVVDEHWQGNFPVDVWVGEKILLPSNTLVEKDSLKICHSTSHFTLVEANQVGLTRICRDDWYCMVRVSRPRYAGRGQFRHLEESNGKCR